MAKTLRQLESEIDMLKEQLAKNSRANDYLEICQLQSMYAHLYFVFQRSKIPDLFAQNTPGVSIEIEDGGVYEGIEGVKKIFLKKLNEKHILTAGYLPLHMTLNPIIEINKGGTKAKGLWFSFGYVAKRYEGKMSNFWCSGKYDMEYVKEDGKWKILKMAYRIVFSCLYEKGWIERPVVTSFFGNTDIWPDKPTTVHVPYDPARINIIPPPPPEPYVD